MPTITEEFSRTIAFYNSSHPQDLINADVPVFVSGDLAAEPDTWKALVSNLNSKVAVLPSSIQYPEEQYVMFDVMFNWFVRVLLASPPCRALRERLLTSCDDQSEQNNSRSALPLLVEGKFLPIMSAFTAWYFPASMAFSRKFVVNADRIYIHGLACRLGHDVRKLVKEAIPLSGEPENFIVGETAFFTLSSKLSQIADRSLAISVLPVQNLACRVRSSCQSKTRSKGSWRLDD